VVCGAALCAGGDIAGGGGAGNTTACFVRKRGNMTPLVLFIQIKMDLFSLRREAADNRFAQAQVNNVVNV